MKRRYAGIAKCFYKGYNELNNQDFFEIDGEDLTNFNLSDRVNLYYKVGSWVDISFSPSEAQIVNLIDKVETFDDTLKAALVLYQYCKEEQKKNSEQVAINSKDGNLDLAVSNRTAGGIVIFLGKGNGIFEKNFSIINGQDGIAIANDDFDKDGIIDLALVSASSHSLIFYRGDGKGNFTTW